MGRLTTHVLATANGRPGVGIAVTLYRLDGGGWGVRSREPQPVNAESAPNARARASATERVDHVAEPATEPFDRENVDPAVLAAALADVERDLTSGGA